MLTFGTDSGFFFSMKMGHEGRWVQLITCINRTFQQTQPNFRQHMLSSNISLPFRPKIWSKVEGQSHWVQKGAHVGGSCLVTQTVVPVGNGYWATPLRPFYVLSFQQCPKDVLDLSVSLTFDLENTDFNPASAKWHELQLSISIVFGAMAKNL